MLNRKYSIDLAGQMAECEANYARIMQLLPDMARADQRSFGLELADSQAARFQVVVKERCKYTTMIDIYQLSSSGHNDWPWLQFEDSTPYFSLRVYHDARMAEVIAYNHHQRLRPSYDYPNDNMYHRDEKAQLNTFLGEWLSYCLEHGYALNNPIAAIPIKT